MADKLSDFENTYPIPKMLLEREDIDTDILSIKEAIKEDKKSYCLYVHIPFCVSQCAFCSCKSAKCKNEEDLESYISSLFDEIGKYEGVLADKQIAEIFI